jgi:hypothetical protein
MTLLQRARDIEVENAKLRSALKVIRDMLDAPDHRDITPEAIYQIAVKAIDGDDQ